MSASPKTNPESNPKVEVEPYPRKGIASLINFAAIMFIAPVAINGVMWLFATTPQSEIEVFRGIAAMLAGLCGGLALLSAALYVHFLSVHPKAT